MSNSNQLQVLLLHQPDGVSNFHRLCQSIGWKVQSSAADRQAMDVLKKQAFDIVIADLALPQPDSAAIVKMIHSQHPDQPLIVVAATANAQDAIAALREGANDYLQQPVDALTLESSVVRAISKKRGCEDAFKHINNLAVQMSFTSAEIAKKDMDLEIVEGLWRAGRIDLDCKLQLHLAFQEALTNSLDHGNLQLESCWKDEHDATGVDRYSQVKKLRLSQPEFAQRKIEVDVKFDACMLEIIIQDQGIGFNIDTLVKPPAKLQEPSLQGFGRGLSLIQSLVDQVNYSDAGRRIRMVKSLKLKQ